MKIGRVVTPHADATAAGMRVLAEGGNAIDAALAAAIVLTVVYPHNCSLGGDLFAVVERPSGQRHAINGSGRAAWATDVAQVRQRYGHRLPVGGPATITVPGAVAGLGSIHEIAGTVPWSLLFVDAIAHAAEGFAVSGSLAGEIAGQGAALLRDAGMRAVFAPDGAPLQPGMMLAQPALAETLRALGDLGPSTFYSGEIGAMLVTGLRAVGSDLQLADLAGHTTDFHDPLHARFAGVDLYTCPPNSQGFVLLKILLVVAALGLEDPLNADADVLARIFGAASREREVSLADPNAMSASVPDMLDADSVATMANAVARGGRVLPASSVQGSGDTVAVVAADGEGNRISLIQSLFHSFGAGILEPRTGIVLQNRGCAFSLDPSSPNVLGPGKRPSHSLTPLIASSTNRSFMLGTMGGKAQPQILTQLLLRLLNGATPTQAVGAPRWIVGGMEVGQPEGTVHQEIDVPASVRERLATLGLPVVTHPGHAEELGHAHVIEHSGAELVGAADPRADGGVGD